MNAKPVSISNQFSTAVSRHFSALALAALLVTAGGNAQAAPAGGGSQAATALRITNTGRGSEALPAFRLDWDALSNTTYLVQSADSPAPGAAWNTLDAVQPADQAGSYQLQVVATDSTGLSSPPATFYRLILPQPRIFSVEPAVVALGVPVDFYVIGQCFPTNAVLQINGVTLAGAVVTSSSEAMIPGFTPDVAGTYQVSLVVSGVVVSAASVTCADPLANPELVLQGPPTQEPLASPQTAALIAPWLSKRGYDYWKAQSDYSFDIEQVLNIGSQSSEAGAGKKDFKGHVTLLKAFDDGSDSSSARTHTKTGHVTLMKAFDDGSGDAGAKKDFKGHVTLLKAFDDGGDGESARTHTKTGHVTLMKAFDDGSDDARTGGGAGDPFLNNAPPIMSGGTTTVKSRSNVRNNFSAGGGVQPFSGEVQECDMDMSIPGRGLDFVWARTYHSRIGRTGASANGWTFSYDVSVQPPVSGACVVRDGAGRADIFKLGTNGTYTCPEFFREGSISNNTFTLTFADTGRWVFNPFDGTAAAGKLHQVITRNGDTMTLGYDTSGRLAQVVDDLSRTNTMAYTSGGHVASVTDFTGRSVTYQYYQGAKGELGGAGDLKSITSPPVTGTPNGNDFPDGKTTTYTYSTGFSSDQENHLLLTVTDPKGQTAAVFSYEHSSTSANYLRCITAQEGTNTASCFTYSAFTGTPHVPVLPWLPSGYSIVNDPVGNVSQYYFDARNRCLIEDDYTGRATPGLPVTDTENRPTGKLRSSDPAYYETTWIWNNDSLCTSETSPGGQQMQYVYQSDFDPATTARKRADCRVVREIASSAVDLDGDGVADVTTRSWHFDYDPRFGSDPTSTALRESPSKASLGKTTLRESPTKSSLRESPTLASTGQTKLRESPTLPSLGQSALTGPKGKIRGIRESPSLQPLGLRESPTKQSVGIRESPSKASLGRTALRESPTLPPRGFCTSATDPRGIVTTASYDSKGNQRVVVNHNPFSIQQFSLAYDANGQLTAVTNAPDANGRSRVDTFSWSQGQVTQCVVDASAGGLALTSAFEYDARGNLTRVIDPRTNDWLFTYNALDQLVQASSALVTANGSLSTFRTATQFAYDANDNLMQCSTQLGDGTGKINRVRVDNYQYDGEDRLSQVALAVDDTHALTNGYAYDGNDQCVQVLGGDAVSGADPNQTAAFQYDERGLLLHATAAPGTALCGTNEYSYDANGCLEKVKLRQGVKVEIDNAFVHDGFGRLASVTDPMGNQTVCFYDANDNPKVVRLFGELNDVPGSAGNVRLAESDYQYDGLDRCVSAKDLFFNPATQAAIGSGQSLTTCAYAPNDECVSVTDTLGHTTTYGYDTACRPVSVTDALGNQQNVVYDAGGNPLVEISSEIQAASGKPQVLAVTNVYDALNRCVSTTDSAGNTSRYAYDSLDRCVQTIDPRGVYAFYSYDFLDRCTVAIGDLNGDGFPDFIHDITTTFSWSSSSGNLLAVTDSNTNTTSYAYDSLGRCLTVTHADGTQEQMTWDPRSNLIWKQDANGTTIANLYDYSDRLVHRDIAARTAAGVAATTTFETFTYDGCDRLTGAANDGGTTAFAYDSLDDCVSETLNGITTTSTYDALGNRLSLTYPGGRALTYTYDALNRCASISDSGQQLVSYTYDGPDRVSQVTYGNGTRTQIAYDGFAGKPNATGDYGFGQISRVRHGIVASGVVIDDRTFSYDPDQNKTSRNLTAPFTLGGAAQAMFFQYDPANRLVDSLVTTNGAVARLTTYGLDRMGNRTNVTGAASCSGDYFLSSILPPGDFQMNRYTTTPCDARTYDSDGNLVGVSSAAGPLTYQYDYVGRLVLVQALNSGTGTLAPVASYDYDAVGRRMHKTVYSGGLPPATTQFLYDGSSVIEERNGTTTAATYVSAGAKSDGRPAYLNFSCVYNEIRLGGHDYFVHTDDQGNTLALTGANGAVMERYDYDDYGAVTFLTSDGTTTSATSSAVGNPYCWGGLRLDAETGLQTDDGGGYFEPQTGRELDGTPHVPVLPVPMWPSGFFSENNPWSGGSPLFNKEKPKPTNNEGKKEFVGHVSILK